MLGSLFCFVSFYWSGLDQKHLSFSNLRSLLICYFSTRTLLFPTHEAFDLRECVQCSPQLVNLSCPIEGEKKKKKVTPACTDSATHRAARSERQQKHTLAHNSDLLRHGAQPPFLWRYSKQVNYYIWVAPGPKPQGQDITAALARLESIVHLIYFQG